MTQKCRDLAPLSPANQRQIELLTINVPKSFGFRLYLVHYHLKLRIQDIAPKLRWFLLHLLAKRPTLFSLFFVSFCFLNLKFVFLSQASSSSAPPPTFVKVVTLQTWSKLFEIWIPIKMVVHDLLATTTETRTDQLRDECPLAKKIFVAFSLSLYHQPLT